MHEINLLEKYVDILYGRTELIKLIRAAEMENAYYFTFRLIRKKKHLAQSTSVKMTAGRQVECDFKLVKAKHWRIGEGKTLKNCTKKNSWVYISYYNIMNIYHFINVIVLCCLNILFFFAGSFLNAVVVLSFWKSNSLRNKVCNFMILVLSCFDLTCVAIIHPLNVSSTLAWWLRSEAMLQELRKSKHVTSVLYALSFCALTTMNIERYLGTQYPIFHRTSVTNNKLMLVLFGMFLFLITLKMLSYAGLTPEQLPSSLTFLVVFTVILPINVKMYIISRRILKRKNKGNAGFEMKRREKNSLTNGYKINDLHEGRSELQEKDDKLDKRKNELHQECDIVQEQGNKLHGKNNKVHEENDKLPPRSNKIQRTGENLHEKRNNDLEAQRKGQNIQKSRNISICILAVMSFLICSLPGMLFNVLNFVMGREWLGIDNFHLIWLWVKTIITLNSTFNTLLFFWKNNIHKGCGFNFNRTN